MRTATVIGGGIAGPVAALALRRAGFAVEVHEARDGSAEGTGAFLTLAANGIDALRCLDIHDLVLADAFDTPKIRLCSAGGSTLAEIPFARLSDGTASRTVRRSTLYTALRHEAEEAGVPIRYGRRLVDAVSTPQGVTAHFEDGTSATADVLVGADGLRSRTRAVIDPDAPRARYVGMVDVGGYAYGVDLDVEPGVMHMVFGKRCFFAYVRHPNGEVWWFANPPSPDEEHGKAMARLSQAQWREHLVALVRGDRTPAAALVEATPELRTGWTTCDLPTVPTWHRGRMLVIGDAAHAASPASGQGAAQALEDAVVLAKCLRDVHEVPAALATFERLRRERVERVVEQGRRNGQHKALGWFPRVVVLPLVLKLLSRRGDPMAWATDHHLEWESRIQPAPTP